MEEKRISSRKTRVGKVVSDKMDKTVVVAIEDRVAHPLYKKIVGRTYKLKAHDEQNTCGVGDIVKVMETRPLSKDKRWRVVEIVEKAKDSGVLGYLVKPVQENNLFPAIEIAMSRWREMQGLEQELAGLRDSLAMRKTLDRAKGILMAAHHLSEPEAYRRIQQYAMMKRLTVKEVAEAIVKAAGGKV